MLWMLVYSKPRQELKLVQSLSKLGIETYCPTVQTVRQWSDRKKKISEPLFKSYVFVRVKPVERHLVFSAKGFSRFVFWLGKPVIVENRIIEETKRFLSGVVHSTISTEHFEIGKEIGINRGPFNGTKGRLLHINGQQATLQIDALGTIVKAKIALADLKV